MRVDLIPTYRSIDSLGSSASLLSEWRVGTILQAVAVRDAKTGQLFLQIGEQQHPARIASGDAKGPPDGERLQLRVLRTSPVLALETLSPTAAENASTESAVAADALRRFVPRQTSPALMLANLSWLAQGKNGTQTLPRSVVEAATRLWQALPEADSLGDPQKLAQAVTRSGAFLETNLTNGDRATTRAAVATDIKALMLSLGRVLREHGARPAAAHADVAMHAPLPTAGGPLTALPAAPASFALADAPAQQMNELARQTDGALARLTTTQIANSGPETPIQAMLIELPVRHEDRAAILRLRIERDGSRRGEPGDSSWSVEAAVDLGSVGGLHARVALTGQRISVQLRAESAQIVETLAARSDELEAMLRGAGLEVDRIVCLHGMPAADNGARPSRLLDVRA